MSFYDKLIPDGYEVVETDERFETSFPPLRFFTKGGAERFADTHSGMSPSWRYVVEKKGWFWYEAVPYHNILRKKS